MTENNGHHREEGDSSLQLASHGDIEAGHSGLETTDTKIFSEQFDVTVSYLDTVSQSAMRRLR